jgi:hypothetical protein
MEAGKKGAGEVEKTADVLDFREGGGDALAMADCAWVGERERQPWTESREPLRVTQRVRQTHTHALIHTHTHTHTHRERE